MGVNYTPKHMYGFFLNEIVVYDEYLTENGCYPEAYRHNNEHVYGMSVELRDLVTGKLPKEVELFGELMKKHFDVRCSAEVVLTGDTCEYCRSKTVSLRTMFKELKPKLSDKELLERYNDICKQVRGRETPVTMKQFREGDDERDKKRSRTCYSEDDASGDDSAAEDSSADDSSGDKNLDN
jgi:hypothetical protein